MNQTRKIIYEVRSSARDNGRVHSWGARVTRAEAEVLLAKQTENPEWADRYHARWWIEEIDATGTFEFPSRPKPRERYSVSTEAISNGPDRGGSLDATVLNASGAKIAQYRRNHSGLMATFEPFRQDERMFALISTDYTATSVLDLASGEVIAAETPHTNGFCPVGFYVPDWWDLHDGSILPGSSRWNSDCEQPSGKFGFVWGCVWGDDSSWKVQYLDLTRVQEGVIKRDERFGYLPLATRPTLEPWDFIRVSFWQGKARVEFDVERAFDVDSGEAIGERDT